MEKLIELLNEYKKSITEIPVYWGKVNGILQYGSYIQQVSVMYMISKHYGFIKRLVDNDKIDHRIYEDIKFTAIKQGVLIDKKSGSTAQETREIIKNGCIDAFIALLAISDEPIEFLISILK